jgi:hypothetical protein
MVRSSVLVLALVACTLCIASVTVSAQTQTTTQVNIVKPVTTQTTTATQSPCKCQCQVQPCPQTACTCAQQTTAPAPAPAPAAAAAVNAAAAVAAAGGDAAAQKTAAAAAATPTASSSVAAPAPTAAAVDKEVQEALAVAITGVAKDAKAQGATDSQTKALTTKAETTAKSQAAAAYQQAIAAGQSKAQADAAAVNAVKAAISSMDIAGQITAALKEKAVEKAKLDAKIQEAHAKLDEMKLKAKSLKESIAKVEKHTSTVKEDMEHAETKNRDKIVNLNRQDAEANANLKNLQQNQATEVRDATNKMNTKVAAAAKERDEKVKQARMAEVINAAAKAASAPGSKASRYQRAAKAAAKALKRARAESVRLLAEQKAEDKKHKATMKRMEAKSDAAVKKFEKLLQHRHNAIAKLRARLRQLQDAEKNKNSDIFTHKLTEAQHKAHIERLKRRLGRAKARAKRRVAAVEARIRAAKAKATATEQKAKAFAAKLKVRIQQIADAEKAHTAHVADISKKFNLLMKQNRANERATSSAQSRVADMKKLKAYNKLKGKVTNTLNLADLEKARLSYAKKIRDIGSALNVQHTALHKTAYAAAHRLSKANRIEIARVRATIHKAKVRRARIRRAGVLMAKIEIVQQKINSLLLKLEQQKRYAYYHVRYTSRIKQYKALNEKRNRLLTKAGLKPRDYQSFLSHAAAKLPRDKMKHFREILARYTRHVVEARAKLSGVRAQIRKSTDLFGLRRLRRNHRMVMRHLRSMFRRMNRIRRKAGLRERTMLVRGKVPRPIALRALRRNFYSSITAYKQQLRYIARLVKCGKGTRNIHRHHLCKRSWKSARKQAMRKFNAIRKSAHSLGRLNPMQPVNKRFPHYMGGQPLRRFKIHTRIMKRLRHKFDHLYKLYGVKCLKTVAPRQAKSVRRLALAARKMKQKYERHRCAANYFGRKLGRRELRARKWPLVSLKRIRVRGRSRRRR